MKRQKYKQYMLEDGSVLILFEDQTIQHIPLTDDGELDFDDDYVLEFLGEDEAEFYSSEEEVNAYA
ncbi:MAG: hypothetical protein KBB32_01505 [Spirochaetia bacterium]|nr:hypothetical protein [Spirochaetia bacterium]